MIYPQGSLERPVQTEEKEKGSGQSWTLLVAALLLAGTGIWIVLKRRGPGGLLPTRAERKIVIEESRSLGNRQYLVVAGYEDRKFLIGVTQGQIQLLARLDESQEDL
ncbi:MAG: flagellar biosynthetic protein FliO [Opitutaceae bacterium]|nr:flagellar biosynthetic protein FliO [Opitutaceae bacterium]